MVQVYARVDESRYYSCGGSIIASRFVITAAHCVHNRTNVRVHLGGFYPGDMEYERLVKQIIVHPGYNSFNSTYDIALLETWFPINMDIYTPVCLRRTGLEELDWKRAEVIVYRNGVQRNLNGHVLPPGFCPDDDDQIDKQLCIIQMMGGGIINVCLFKFNL